MTDKHPIIPPPELVEQWHSNSPFDRGLTLATQAAQWGADQELEACCEWFADDVVSEVVSVIAELRAARRPKPPSLKEQPVAIGLLWQPCVKLPIIVHVREQRPGETHISTREGITPLRHDDLIMRGVQGEEYLIGRELFEQTYRMWTPELPALAEQPVAPTDEELLQIFDTVCLSEGGTVDEIHLRGLRAVLARWGQQAPTSIPMDKLDRLIALDRDDPHWGQS